MDPSRTSKFRVAASTLGLVSLGGAPVRAVSRLFRESDGNYARVGLVDGEIVSTASAVQIATRPSSLTSKVRRADNFADHFAALLRTGFMGNAVASSTASVFLISSFASTR
jgi:hypothetical protein